MAGVPMRCVLKKPFMLSGCVGFPNKAFPPPDLCSPKRGAACPTEALHNRRGAGLRDRVRAAAYAVCRRRFAARRRGLAERKDVFAVCRGFRGFRKVVLRALTPARPVWRAPFPARSAADTGLRHTAGPAGERTAVGAARSASVLACAGGACGYAVIGCATPTAGAACAGCRFGARARERMCYRTRRCGKIAKKDSPLVTGGGISAAARSAAFALALGGFVYWPESTFASRQPSRLPMRKAGKKRFSARAGAAAGRLRAVDRGLRNSSAGGGHGMRRVMK